MSRSHQFNRTIFPTHRYSKWFVSKRARNSEVVVVDEEAQAAFDVIDYQLHEHFGFHFLPVVLLYHLEPIPNRLSFIGKAPGVLGESEKVFVKIDLVAVDNTNVEGFPHRQLELKRVDFVGFDLDLQ